MPTDISRAERIRHFLEEQRMVGWFSWRPEELLMQIGYQTYWGVSFLLFLKDEDPLLFQPALEPRDALPASVQVVEYPWGNLSCADPFAVLSECFDQELARRSLSRSSLGAMRESYRSSLPLMSAEQPPLPPRVLDRLTRGMSSDEAGERSFQKLFLNKTKEEIENIRLANRVAQVGLKAWHASLLPETSEVEAAAVAEAAIQAMVGHAGIHSARAWAMVQSGPHSAEAGRFNRSSGRRFCKGDCVLIELATCVNGYWSDLTRTEVVGTPIPEIEEAMHAVSAAQRKAAETAGPGVAAEAVDHAARAVLTEAGLGEWFSHATGHHTGFRYHDNGFAIQPGSHELLEPGMVFTIEPGVYIPGLDAGIRIEDNYTVTPLGIDCLSSNTIPVL